MQMTALNSDQLKVLERLVNYSKAFQTECYRLMKNAGLLEIDGCRMKVEIDARFDSFEQTIEFGHEDSDFGELEFVKGRMNDEYETCDFSTDEYRVIFANEDFRKRVSPFMQRSDDISLGDLWMSDSDDSAFLDRGV